MKFLLIWINFGLTANCPKKLQKYVNIYMYCYLNNKKNMVMLNGK